jgi:SAM-dependent methyltransferase
MKPATDTGAELRAQYDDQGGVTGIFSAKVADYLASRPDYPLALFDALRARVPAGATVADLGAGTGLLTRGLLSVGYRVLAVEPNAAMRAAADHLLSSQPDYRSVDGSAEAMSAPDGSLDLITAAQAFHWFDIERARAEMLRVLKPNGLVALIWNDRQPGEALHVALDEVFADFGGARRNALLAHEDRQDVPRFFAGGASEEFTWPHQHLLDADGLLSLVFSRSYMPERQSPAGTAAAREVRHIFDQHATDGRVAVRYRTVAILGRPATTTEPPVP